jgi:hypothetical protein
MNEDAPSARPGQGSEPTRNLVLVHEPDIQDFGDLEAIASEVRALAPDIEVFIASNEIPSSLTRKHAARRPALIYSPTELRRFRPLRGKIYAGTLMTKDTQLNRLAQSGIAVPEFALLTDNLIVDPKRFGPIALLKPTGFSSHGRGIEMVRTDDIAGLRWRHHPLVKEAPEATMMIQRFVDTGLYPSHMRVLTLFGETIFAFRAISEIQRPPLGAASEELAKGPFMAKHGQRRLVVPVEPEVLDFARSTFKAIPEVALHGCDIIRETTTGQLYALEINPGGNTWSFSSGWAHILHEELAMKDLSTQYDAWKVCARKLVEHTRGEAV